MNLHKITSFDFFKFDEKNVERKLYMWPFREKMYR